MEDNRVYGFSKEDANALVESIGVTGQESVERPQFAVRMMPAYARHAVAPSGGIPAKSGSTMGSASCTLQKCNASGVLSNNGSGTVYNPSTTAIAANAAIVYIVNSAGLRVAIVESCS